METFRVGLMVCVLMAPALLAVPAGAANDGVQDPAAFEQVEVYIIVAKRSAVANDDARKAVHLEGIAQAERQGNSLRIHERSGGDTDTDGDGDSDEDGFIAMDQSNPGKSRNTNAPRGHLSDMQLTLVNNTFEGTGLFVFDSDGDGVAYDPDNDSDNSDFGDDGIDDDDQVIPVRVRVGQRSNSKTDFLQGTLHNALDDAGSIGGAAATTTDQPRINGRVRSGRQAGE